MKRFEIFVLRIKWKLIGRPHTNIAYDGRCSFNGDGRCIFCDVHKLFQIGEMAKCPVGPKE